MCSNCSSFLLRVFNWFHTCFLDLFFTDHTNESIWILCFNASHCNNSNIFGVCITQDKLCYVTVTNIPKSNCPKIAKACFSLVLQVLCELARSLLCLVLTQRYWLMEQPSSRTLSVAMAIKKELSKWLMNPQASAHFFSALHSSKVAGRVIMPCTYRRRELEIFSKQHYWLAYCIFF